MFKRHCSVVIATCILCIGSTNAIADEPPKMSVREEQKLATLAAKVSMDAADEGLVFVEKNVPSIQVNIHRVINLSLKIY